MLLLLVVHHHGGHGGGGRGGGSNARIRVVDHVRCGGCRVGRETHHHVR